ncbi:growth-regulated protein homolog gamma-like isoform X1 [Canis lupus dingo]|uniref:growth-regulated protein homolog gamma-like isoform X1 n=1 Tax=Canis lupus dingo TaxID=286419 RepID=UPI0020C1BC86|nr:growth-regulated protein homolog gamma-like isoform X1 [Canis lupus dingo]
MAPAAPRAPRAPRPLGAARLLLLLLLLLLLGPAGRRAAGAPVVAELRCQCLQTLQGIHLRNIQNVQVTPSGPHCARTEVVATLKDGREVCLNPEAPLVKRMIQKMLSKPSQPELERMQQPTA